MTHDDLLSGSLLRKADMYHNHNDPETSAYMPASQSNELVYKRKLAITYLILWIVVFLLIISTGLIFWTLAPEWYYYFKTASIVERLTASRTEESKFLALRDLASYGLAQRLAGVEVDDIILSRRAIRFSIDFSGAKLVDLEMQGAYGSGVMVPVKATFTGSTIEGGRFIASNLNISSFANCTLKNSPNKKAYEELERTSFERASLIGADFSGCIISKTSFDNADLSGANFSGARISDGSSFIGANLTGANFADATVKDTRFTDANLANADFSKAHLFAASLDRASVQGAIFQDIETDYNLGRFAWWLAYWPETGFTKLKQEFPPQCEEGILDNSNTFQDLLFKVERARALRNTRPEKGSGSDALPTALNDLAWYLVSSGLPKKAEPYAREALDLLPGNQYIADTLGYALLQLGRYQEAAQFYQSFMNVDVNKQPPITLQQPVQVAPGQLSAPAFVGGGPRYRFGLVLKALGEQKEAEILFDSARTYVPTHENALVGARSNERCPG